MGLGTLPRMRRLWQNQHGACVMFKKIRDDYRREKEAAIKVAEVIQRASARGYVEPGDAAYKNGKITKAQRKSIGK